MRFSEDDYKKLLKQLECKDTTTLMDILNQRLDGCASCKDIVEHENFEHLFKQMMASDTTHPAYTHFIEQHKKLAKMSPYLQHSHASTPAKNKAK